MAKLSERVPPSGKALDKKDVKVGDIVRVTMTKQELEESWGYQGCLTLGDEVTVTYVRGGSARLANEGEGCYLEIDSPAFELVVDKDEGTEDNTPAREINVDPITATDALDKAASLWGLNRIWRETDAELRGRLLTKCGQSTPFKENPLLGEGVDKPKMYTRCGSREAVMRSIQNIEIKGTLVFPEDTTKETLNKTGVQNMTKINTVQIVNVTLVDTNPNLKGAGKIVFQKLNVITEHNEEATKQDIVASGKVMASLKEHNEKRVKVVDKAILRATGRDIMLEEIELLSDPELEWNYIIVG